jgi:hypothetical protein
MLQHQSNMQDRLADAKNLGFWRNDSPSLVHVYLPYQTSTVENKSCRYNSSAFHKICDFLGFLETIPQRPNMTIDKNYTADLFLVEAMVLRVQGWI